MLADYAVCLEGSRGRRHPEPKHAYRNDFQRDRDRVVHARAFRRLDSKTQVFTRRYSDHFRNRLTHTLEVAQISRTVAAQLGLNVDLADEVAYDTADLDDGYEARLLSLEAIRAGVPVFERYYRDVEQIYPDAIEKLKFNEAIKRMLDGMVSDLIRNTGKRIEESRIRSLDDIRNCPHRL